MHRDYFYVSTEAGSQRLQWSTTITSNVYIRCDQAFHAVMNTGCYKITPSSCIIQRASTTILFWYQRKYQRRGWTDLIRKTHTITRNRSANEKWDECLWKELIPHNITEKKHWAAFQNTSVFCNIFSKWIWYSKSYTNWKMCGLKRESLSLSTYCLLWLHLVFISPDMGCLKPDLPGQCPRGKTVEYRVGLTCGSSPLNHKIVKLRKGPHDLRVQPFTTIATEPYP